MNNQLEATVIGLGMMGSTLARLLLRAGYRVTVWNRTSEKADALVREGATLAPSAAAAVGASSIVVVCVHDYEATQKILGPKDVALALAGKVLVQLTTGSPQEASDSEAWARELGAEYLDGAIQAAPSQMGRPDTPIFVSGTEGAFQRSKPVLEIFGGSVSYLGEQVSAASTMDLATLSYIYGAVLGFFHGARIIESQGLDVRAYGSLVAGISPTFGAFLEHEGRVIQSGNYAVSESPLEISIEAMERIAQQARDSRINAAFPTFATELFRKAKAAGYGEEELASLIKVLRKDG